ncbi:alpha/beta-hydrolase [Aaosphaeria arxii CBS 175.79]|uniref:Alpha/beta-hydrolase n=1 Tax=Aaosphaeria arxii CBS 175.79 TaxID=1450172 RepID=A0A6A5Y9B6_9PLEO|nr:alpha/beta-hydrolase [Aaosphaeria arxii CBS 175.79]KAF2022008.1 alpha/beta-hydrolase [Aaosphaeria arxii CBS 175.79]
MSSSYGPDDCRYPLDTTTSSTLTLPDGRKLAYAEYGSPAGAAIIYHHGFPGSRIEASSLHHAASKVGARIIAIDRPSFGWSSPHPDRTLLSHAKDTGVLADHLKLTRYGVLGVSGGGPYALACARALPADNLRAVGVVCGLGPPDMGYRGMKFMNYLGWTFGQRMFPGLCRWWFSREPGARLDLPETERMELMRQGFEKSKASMHPKDAAFFGDLDQRWVMLRTAAEAFSQGMGGFSQDFRLLNSDFGFRIEEIRKDLKVQIWHGTLDENVPTHHGEMVAKRIGDNATLKITDDTHASIFRERKEEYLGKLVKAIQS